ncbi:hypothetical protein NQ318_009963 [Aromia moschata]|uniref:Spaetzle domain-containing protein n=1 Tax=Aromia moschata TaxID=1265417 RepID=A0AAV8X569_9CUCU|nr:hypothetical protein NQ318_009963 [Aromia moschata]
MEKHCEFGEKILEEGEEILQQLSCVVDGKAPLLQNKVDMAKKIQRESSGSKEAEISLFNTLESLPDNMMSISNSRPPLVRHPVDSPGVFFYETVTPKKTSRPVPKPIHFEKSNKTKEERILNTSNRAPLTRVTQLPFPPFILPQLPTSTRSTAPGPIAFEKISEQDIVFPDTFEVYFEPVQRIDGPPRCAEDGTFCENFDAYPYLHLKGVLQKQEVDKEFFFGEDEIPVELEKRIGSDEDSFLCSGISRVVFPKVGKNKDNEWKFIVNQGKEDGYVQGVRIETCRSKDGPCDIIGELPQGYRSVCKQKYIYRRMLSVKDDGSFIPDTFQLPSSCCCSYKRDVDFLLRSAVPPKK